MSHNLVESDAFTATVPVTDIADTTYPAVEAQMGQALANRTRYHENTLTGNYIGTALDQLSIGESLQQFVPLPSDGRLGSANPFRALAAPLLQNFRWLKERLPGFRMGNSFVDTKPIIIDGAANAVPRWRTGFTAGGVPVAVQVDNTSAGRANFALPFLPSAGSLISIYARVIGDPNVTHAGLPGNRPSFTLNRYVATAGGYGVAVLGTATDNPADLAAYRAAHTFGLTGLTQDLSADAGRFHYDVTFTGEYGANSETLALWLLGFELTIYGGNL